ncbi:FAD/NAD(P)-binding protein [Leucobacter chromiireducens]|uniref:FAD/NAD(P)-binding protein n=1 Tax=Leucobacter chromiireducens TaxID=283877 RepID=UPI000F63E747|nr:FAD/NAD(P)-binding protein [Leucobacter chromiireducens]
MTLGSAGGAAHTDRALGIEAHAEREAVEVVCVGAGPAAVMLLERIIASHARDRAALPLHIRLVDPHRPGGGRIWRREQSPLLKLNSMLRDVAFFTDPSCQLDGPVAPGPSLAEWVAGVRDGRFPVPEWADELLRREIAEIADDGFPTRRLNNAYLGWAVEETLRRAASTVRVSWVADTAVAVADADGARGGAAGAATGGGARHAVQLASGRTLLADLVIYALGHAGTDPSADTIRLAEFARAHDLTYVPPAFTADVDFSEVSAGADVIVRGMGLAAIDLSVLLAEGRGGRFARRADGTLGYTPSGREPVLHFASRRGVPYRSKITSQVVGEAVRLEYLGAEFHAAVASRSEPLDFARDAWPLISAELLTGYYRELFTGHPARVTDTWEVFAPRLRAAIAEPEPGTRDEAIAELIRTTVPDPRDRFDLAAFDHPLRFLPEELQRAAPTAAADDVHERVLAHIAEDLRLRTQPENSATQALFLTGLYAFLALAEVAPDRWNAHSRTRALPRRWASYFSYLASGPPGHRLEELSALAEAGVVRFLGGDVELEADAEAGLFRAVGRAVTGVTPSGAPVSARAEAAAAILIDAWLPEARAAVSDNPLLRQLVASGRVRELAVPDPRGGAVETTGQIEAAPDGSLPGAPRQFALGPFVAGLTGGAFTRPGINSLPFRVHDRCARAVLEAAAEVWAERAEHPRELVSSGAAATSGA